MKLLERQEVYWKQRIKQFWLKEVDQNTRFFHKFASGRKWNNQVKWLMKKHDEWKEGDEDIQGIIVDNFSDLFKSAMEVNGLTERENVKRITEEQNGELGTTVTSEEVKMVVFSMHPEKSPGVDGLNPAFFQTYWSIVGLDVTKFCQEFFNTGELMEGINRTLVCLILKVK